jgi:hypothetical protein
MSPSTGLKSNSEKMENITVYYKETVECRYLLFCPDVRGWSTAILPNVAKIDLVPL